MTLCARLATSGLSIALALGVGPAALGEVLAPAGLAVLDLGDLARDRGGVDALLD